jgi:L,D-peptidoglycan transpeptidase YkuD (ErfK/YbiS/YcfS/YnhG family)
MRAVVRADGLLVADGLVLRATLGRGGVRVDKREGDGATPAGLLPLRRVLYRADRLRPPRCAVPIEPLSPNDGWCDDPDDADYNRPVTLPHPARHEALWRGDAVYDVIGVLGWNDAPVRRGQGSAIFLHVSRPNRAPTEGCVALALPDLLRLLQAGLTEIEVQPG